MSLKLEGPKTYLTQYYYMDSSWKLEYQHIEPDKQIN